LYLASPPRSGKSESDTMLRPKGLPITALLTALVALGPLSTDLYLPSLPGMARSFPAPVAEVQLTLSVFLVGLALGQLAYGPLCDRFGRRPALLVGLAIYAVASLACLLAPTIGLLIGLRFLQAVGACAGPVICRAIVRDVHGRDGAARIYAYMGAAMALAPTLGPILGGFLDLWFGWRAAFAALTLYGAAGLCAAALALPETNPAPDPHAARPRHMLSNYLSLIGERTYLGYVLCCTFAYGGIFAFISGSSFVLVDRIGLPPSQYGFCFAAVVVGYIIGTLSAGRLTRRLGVDRLILVGGAIAAASGLAMVALAWNVAAGSLVAGALRIVLPMLVYMIGIGLTLPSALAGAIGPFPRRAGAASALLGFTQMAVAAAIGGAIGLMHDGTARPMAGAIALVALVVPLAHRFLARARGAAAAIQ
jgi:DHA1 family bicyclomycin/chloramphenicol resistance-like MFS transporter